MWPFFAKKFVKNNYRVIALDLPPFGESTYNDQINYSIENQAKN
jgi:pimeloyl-ACP methyl ester carboxylesterase